jgi:hypothetical protein
LRLFLKKQRRCILTYQTRKTRLTAAQKTAQENAIVAKEKSASDLKRKYFGPEGELAKMRENLIKPIQDQIYNAVKSLSERYGYAWLSTEQQLQASSLLHQVLISVMMYWQKWVIQNKIITFVPAEIRKQYQINQLTVLELCLRKSYLQWL